MKFELNRNKIKGIMAEKSITQRDLAHKLKLTETQTSKKLKNRVDFKVEEFLMICEMLESNPSLFFASAVDEKGTK